MFKVKGKVKEGEGTIVKVDFPIRPEPGQFMTILTEGKEIPVGVLDYEDGELSFFLERGDIRHSWVYLKGPLGTRIPLEGYHQVIGISNGTWDHDLHYPIKVASAKGIPSRISHDIPAKVEDDTLLLISLPREELRLLSPQVLMRSMVYARWVKMNCAVGVCGVCEYRGFLTCVEGPFIRGDKLVA